ncbi:MAG: hypothetical protein AAFV53_39945 [Myxococcota bacterium]
MLWLWLMLACESPTPTRPDLGPDPHVAADAVRGGLDQALQLWRNGHYDDAQQAVQRTYVEHFEPLEPALDAHDPDQRLALEYAFGRLTWQMRRRGQDAAVASAVDALQQDTARALKQLQIDLTRAVGEAP